MILFLSVDLRQQKYLLYIHPFLKKKFIAFSIIPEKVPFHPAWIIPKYFFPKITIGAQSAVKTPRIKSFLFEIIPSPFKV